MEAKMRYRKVEKIVENLRQKGFDNRQHKEFEATC